MLLGQVLERLGDDAFCVETLLTLGDLPLLAEIEAAGSAFGESAAAYACGAARRFAGQASDEDWLALMTALQRADDAGATCLRHMLVWSLRHDAEPANDGCGSSSCTCEGS